MINISEVVIYSFDKGDESWDIEGEIYFESDLSSTFSTSYLPDEDEFEFFEMDLSPGKYDQTALKDMILDAAEEFEH